MRGEVLRIADSDCGFDGRIRNRDPTAIAARRRARLLRCSPRRSRYGHLRLAQADRLTSRTAIRSAIALIQGNSLAEWKLDPNRERQIMDEYIALSEQAVAKAARAWATAGRSI